MQTDPRHEAVLVIDLQSAMFSGLASPPLAHANTLLEHVLHTLAWARRSGRPVCFIRHDADDLDDPLAPGADGWPVWPGLGQRHDEPTFSKSVGDAFSQPALIDWLAAHDITRVVLLGAQTEFCVNATLNGALARGLAVTVIDDAHGTWDQEAESAQAIIARHNAAFAARGATLIKSAALR